MLLGVVKLAQTHRPPVVWLLAHTGPRPKTNMRHLYRPAIAPRDAAKVAAHEVAVRL
jgi:hypothetical protein